MKIFQVIDETDLISFNIIVQKIFDVIHLFWTQFIIVQKPQDQFQLYYMILVPCDRCLKMCLKGEDRTNDMIHHEIRNKSICIPMHILQNLPIWAALSFLF